MEIAYNSILKSAAEEIFHEMSLESTCEKKTRNVVNSFLNISIGITGSSKGYFNVKVGDDESRGLARYIGETMGFALTEEEMSNFQTETFSELANQVSGRFITLLSTETGNDFDITPPTVFIGSKIDFSPGADFLHVPHVFSISGYPFLIEAWIKT